MTPLQLFYAMARYNEEHGCSDEASNSTRPTVVDHVQIPNLHYNPCSTIESRLEVIIHDNQQGDGSIRFVPLLDSILHRDVVIVVMSNIVIILYMFGFCNIHT